MSCIELYTDGSSIKNPGMSAYAYIIKYEYPNSNSSPLIIQNSKAFRLSTNNRMEVMAAINGLRDIKDRVMNRSLMGISQINLTTDSEYLSNAINNRWLNKWSQNYWMTSSFKNRKPMPVKNKDLWQQYIDIQKEINNLGIRIVVIHVNGHSGHEYNEMADKLAVSTANNGYNYEEDTGYISSLNNNYRR